MKKGQCPKCSSSNIRKKTNGLGLSGKGTVVLAVTWISACSIDLYTCTDCGYLEMYIADRDKLPKIAEKWDSVNRLG